MESGKDQDDVVIVGIEASGTVTAALTVDQLTRLLQGLGATPATVEAAIEGQSAPALSGETSDVVALERRRRA